MADAQWNREELLKTLAVVAAHPATFETRHRRQDGTFVDVEVSASGVKWQEQTVIFAVHRDISTRKRNEAEIRRLYEQTRSDAQTKTELLREVNHRVKNNLLGILGLLLSERQHTPPEDRAMVDASLGRLTQRIQGLLQAHQMLSDSQWTPMPLSRLAERVMRAALSAVPAGQMPGLAIAPSEVQISPRQASHVALVLNELVTNSLKYALPGRTRILISFQAEQEGKDLRLTYRDDGPGYPPEILTGHRANVGLSLIRQLVTETLRGSITLTNDPGAVCTLRIKTENPAST